MATDAGAVNDDGPVGDVAHVVGLGADSEADGGGQIRGVTHLGLPFPLVLAVLLAVLLVVPGSVVVVIVESVVCSRNALPRLV